MIFGDFEKTLKFCVKQINCTHICSWFHTNQDSDFQLFLILDFFYSSKPPVVSSLTCDKINVQGIKKQVYFSKMITVDQKTTSNIPVERYCLGYALNQQTYNMSQNGSRSLQSKKMQMFKNLIPCLYWVYP